MAKWGTYPPDEQLRLKREAAEEMYEALVLVARRCGPLSQDGKIARAAIAKARGEAA